ncbi:hypothetical protein HLRTI_001018 [Halorhabdus tiamatea SARL4B]|uniref:DUF7311 domain-containing protein n=1 Tax=Halorhabdus tiamatea SARL4B TaxID=1033806 RepID=F7PHU6_9EURY|nr:hypothetical protein [Halorhabdus tiamatea]ERJ06940.1 hypothetical protein HLRTI_001018 [Halorhabdus tiamatea SARL4B]CCQ32359.1 hypothetical protein HTIA_0208 [Halorhabdus tiamatea SARL4B]
MIRYVLAILLTVALLGIGVAGVDHATTIRSEAQVETQIAEIESAVTSLHETEEPTPTEQAGARRVLELDLPSSGFASEPVDTFRIRPDAPGITTIEYRVDGRMTRTKHIETIIKNHNASDGTTDLSGVTGRVTLALSLTAARSAPGSDPGTYVTLRVLSRGR